MSKKMRVYELAKEYEIPSKEFVLLLNKKNIPVKNHMSVLTDDQLQAFRKNNTKEALQQLNTKVKQESSKKVTEKTAQESGRPGAAAQHKPQREKANNQPRGKQNRNGESRQNRSNNGPKSGEQRGRAAQNQNGERSAKNTQDKNNRTPQSSRNNRNNRNERSGSEAVHKNGGARRTQGQNQNKRRASGGEAQNQPVQNKAQGQNRGKTAEHKQKKNFKDKHAERPIKLRDNRKRTKSKRVDYKKQREERRADQKRSQVYEIPELLTVGELAETLDIAATDIIKVLMMSGTMASINQQIDADTAQIVASELGYEVKPVTTEDVMDKIFEDYDSQQTGHEVKRPPVVTVMGHVDHGKTSLLDKIRKTNVTAGEAGGITQHIGAYTVRINGEKITFIDTPGHAAFTAMRSRGAQMTDIAVLVVAADDGVMPQTIEAINHAKAAEVPIIVAINKIDKEGANPERVKQELTEQGIVVEEWGGDVIAVPISAKKGTNINELLEDILLVAEVEELKADPERPGRGAVIEAEVKKGKGPTASLLVQQGTLHVGDTLISGTTYGKIRTMIDDKGKRIKKAGPSTPVEISGLSDIPVAGDDFIVLEDEKEARQLAEKRQEMEKFERQHKNAVNLNDLFTRIQEGQISDVNLIVKADVQGSVEALKQSLERLNTDEVRVNVIHGAVGAINETDVMLASTSNAVIIGFNVRPDKNAIAAAEKEEVDMRLYRVIYDAIEDVKKAMEGLLEPEYVEKVTGDADVREVFKIPGGAMIAGSYVTDGKITRGQEVRVIRDGIVIFEGEISSLRRFKDDVKEVAQGYECGIGIDRFNDVKVGDVIETFVMEAVKREL